VGEESVENARDSVKTKAAWRYDVGQSGKHSLQLMHSFAAWDAFAAGLIREKVEKIPGYIDHTGIFIQYQHAARTDRSSQFCKLIKIQRSVEETLGNRTSPRSSKVKKDTLRYKLYSAEY
jgi:hypothetical protein